MTRPNMRDITVSEAICEAICAEMEIDEKVLVLGEDIGVYGGVFGATDGLLARFGADRVRDTPVSEMAFTGMGVGLAMAGYRPLVEIMFADFVTVCLEQIVNAMAKNTYMSGGRARVPMTIRMAGGSIGSAAQHSQCVWGALAHWPGLKIVAPSCPADYRGLTASAIRSDDPVIVIEHKSQLNRRADRFLRPDVGPDGDHLVPIGTASVVRTGGDVTVVAVSAAVEWALEAAADVEAEGIAAEVIDLRSVVPLDMACVASSLEKTGRLLVVDEDYQSFGLSGEVVARAVERMGPGALRQVRRLCMPDVPLPAARTLEDAVLPGRGAIAAALKEMSGGQ